jgi:membrane protein
MPAPTPPPTSLPTTRALTTLRQRAEHLWDILRRVWIQASEDNVLFLAGGLAFNVLLALVPFVLLLVTGLSFLLGRQPEEAARSVTELFDRLLPQGTPFGATLLREVVGDILATRRAVTTWSAVGFAWFSTRLFGSVRSVLALIFDGTDRSIVTGKLFDFAATGVATVVVVLYVVFSAWLDLATTQGVALLLGLGLAGDAIGGLGYVVGRLVAILIVIALFHALYRGLPRHRPTRRNALVGAVTAALLFEVARNLYTLLLLRVDPSSIYTGTIAAIVSVVFWTYYGSLLFLIGAEVTQAYGLDRAERAALARP